MFLELLDLARHILLKILEKKINKIIIIDEKDVNDKLIQTINNFECLIIDNFKNKINEKIFYSLLNQSNN